jgi:hypothetical protein
VLQEKEQPQRPKVLDQDRPEVVLSLEPLHRVLREFVMLSRKQHDEVGLDIEYLPDIEAMLSYGDKSVLVTARYDKTLIGYIFYLIGPHKHNVQINYAQIEAIYLLPAFRNAPLILKMLKLGEAKVREHKVLFIKISSTYKKRIDKLLEYLNYKPIETVYKKDLDYGQ